MLTGNDWGSLQSFLSFGGSVSPVQRYLRWMAIRLCVSDVLCRFRMLISINNNLRSNLFFCGLIQVASQISCVVSQLLGTLNFTIYPVCDRVDDQVDLRLCGWSRDDYWYRTL